MSVGSRGSLRVSILVMSFECEVKTIKKIHCIIYASF